VQFLCRLTDGFGRISIAAFGTLGDARGIFRGGACHVEQDDKWCVTSSLSVSRFERARLPASARTCELIKHMGGHRPSVVHRAKPGNCNGDLAPPKRLGKAESKPFNSNARARGSPGKSRVRRGELWPLRHRDPGLLFSFFVTKVNWASNRSCSGVTITAFYLPQRQEFVAPFVG